MSKSTIRLESRDELLLVALWTEIMSSSRLLQTVAIFAYIIKIITMFINTIFQLSKKLKELKIMYQNAVFGCIS